MARVNPAGLAKLRARLTPLALAGAQAAADVARDKLSGPGSGLQYARLPNRSSAEGSTPPSRAAACGTVSTRRGREPARPLGRPAQRPRVRHGAALQTPDMGGRPFMDDLLQDRDVHRAVRAAMG